MEPENMDVVMHDAYGEVTSDLARARVIAFFVDDHGRPVARRLATQAIVHELDESGCLVRETIGDVGEA